MTRLLITGAAGVLAREIVAHLEGLGDYQLRLTDLSAFETPHELRCADLTDPAQVAGLAEGVDEVLHVAAIHPWKPYTPQQYLDCNIKATYNVLEEAVRAQVRRVIYTSSVAAMGYEVTSQCPLPLDETKLCHPVDSVYSVTKHVGEQFCQMFQHTHGLRWLALRPGTFIPREASDPQYALNLLGIGVHREDVAQAHVRALQSELAHEAFIATAGVPFRRDESAELLTDARSVILRYYPQAAALEEAGVRLPERLGLAFSVEKARRMLGYEPKHTFGKWLEEWLNR